MKQKNILTWAISAIIYLGLVIGGYTVYASLDSNDDHTDTHTATLMSKHITIIILANEMMVRIQLIQIM
jgi:hypothetical protein